MRALLAILALSYSVSHGQHFGLFAEGPDEPTYGIFYSSSHFLIKNGYSYLNRSSKYGNRPSTTTESKGNGFSSEVSPGLILPTSFLDFQFCPAYRFTLDGNSNEAANTTFSYATLSHAFEFNVILAKGFMDRYSVGAGTSLVRYQLDYFESKSDYPSNSGQTDEETHTHGSAFTNGLNLFISFSAAFF